MELGRDPEYIEVTKVTSVVRNGAYLPLTPDGTIVVNGVLSSTYVSIDHITPEITGRFLGLSQHNLFHWWLAPYRMVCLGISSKLYENDYDEQDGIIYWLKFGETLAEFGEKQHPLLQFLGVTIVFAGLFVLVVAEYLICSRLGATVLLLLVLNTTMWKFHHVSTKKKTWISGLYI